MAMGHNTHQYQSVFFNSFSLSYICEKMLIDDFLVQMKQIPAILHESEKNSIHSKKGYHKKFSVSKTTHTIFESYHGLALIVDKMELAVAIFFTY